VYQLRFSYCSLWSHMAVPARLLPVLRQRHGYVLTVSFLSCWKILLARLGFAEALCGQTEADAPMQVYKRSGKDRAG